MILYRGVKDIIPSKIDHRWIGDAVYGRGTYYGLTYEVGERYLSPAKIYKALTLYECEPANPLRLNSEDIPRLKHFVCDQPLIVTKSFKDKLGYLSNEILSPNLCQIAFDAGYDSIILTGGVEGGEQFIIPESSALVVTPVKIEFSLYILTEKVRALAVAHLESDLGLKITGNSHGLITIDLPIEQIDSISQFLDFFERIRLYEVLDCDFRNKTVEYYDED